MLSFKHLFKFLLFFIVLAAPRTTLASVWSVSSRVGYLSPTEKTVRDIYGNGMPFYELEVDYSLGAGWDLFAAAGHAYKSGRSIGLRDKTTLQYWLGEGGVIYRWQFENGLRPYLGIGLTYSLMDIHNDSPFVEQKVRKYGFGGIVKAGLAYVFYNGWSVEAFTNYNYIEHKGGGCSKPHVNFSNLIFGLGVSIPLGP